MTDHDRIVSMEADLKALRQDVSEMKADIKGELRTVVDTFKAYVSQHEFGPVKTVVYGFCGAILLSVLATLGSYIGLKVSK